MNEWGTPVSKDKIIARRNKLIEYQKIGEVRFTPLYEVIDENILDINYMIYEIERLNKKYENAVADYEEQKYIINKAIEYIKKHQRKDEFLNLNEWQTRDLLNILKGEDKDDN